MALLWQMEFPANFFFLMYYEHEDEKKKWWDHHGFSVTQRDLQCWKNKFYLWPNPGIGMHESRGGSAPNHQGPTIVERFQEGLETVLKAESGQSASIIWIAQRTGWWYLLLDVGHGGGWKKTVLWLEQTCEKIVASVMNQYIRRSEVSVDLTTT